MNTCGSDSCFKAKYIVCHFNELFKYTFFLNVTGHKVKRKHLKGKLYSFVILISEKQKVAYHFNEFLKYVMIFAECSRS